MGLKCKITYNKGVANVVDESGNPSRLYSEVLSIVNDQDIALNVWATAYEKDFGATGEDTSVETLVKYFDSKIASEQSMNAAEKMQIKDFMQRNGIETFNDLHMQLAKIFKPNGVFEIDIKQAVSSGIYSQQEIKDIDVKAVQSILSKIEGHLVNEDFVVAPQVQQYRHKNSERTTILGTYERVTYKEIDDAIVREVKSFTDVESFYEGIKNLPYEDFVNDFLENDEFALEVMNRFKDLKKIPKLSIINGEMSDGDNHLYTTIKNTMMVLTDNISVAADIDYLDSISQDIWDENQEDIKQVLKEIEESLVGVNIDIIGLAENSNEREKVMLLLETVNNFIKSPNEQTIQPFVAAHKATIESSDNIIAQELPENYIGYNIVSLHSNKTENELFSKFGLIKIDENLYHKVEQNANLDDIMDYIYGGIRDGIFDIEVSDIKDKKQSLKEIANFLMVREGISHIENSDIYSAYQVAFRHTPITVKKEHAAKITSIKTEPSYLKSKFVSDFYNYILREKVKDSEVYKNTLSKFIITDKDISLTDEITTIEGLEYKEELEDYIALKRDSKMKYLITKDSKLSEDMLYLNFPETKKEYEGDIIKDGDYIITNKTADKYLKLNGEIYRKELSKINSDLFIKITTPKDAIYYTANTNFDFDKVEANKIFEKYGNLTANQVSHQDFQNIIARSRVNDNMLPDLKELSTLKDKSYIFFETGNSIVAFKDGTRVGGIKVTKTKEGYTNPEITVSESHRHQGVGTELYLNLFNKIAKEDAVYYPSATRTKQAQNIHSRMEDLLIPEGRGFKIGETNNVFTRPMINSLLTSLRSRGETKFQQQLFVSNARVGVENVQQKSATPAQWVKMITDKGGKGTRQELDWIGLEDFLNDYQKENNLKSIPKEVVEQYINDNQIEIVQVTKGKGVEWTNTENTWRHGNYKIVLEDGEDYVIYRGDKLVDSKGTLSHAQETVKEISAENQDGVNTKYEQYILEGGENYREVLLKLPSDGENTHKAFENYLFFLQDKYETNNGDELQSMATEEENAKWSKLSNARHDENNEEFETEHFKENNILAHVRMNERTLPNGERVLFIEEMQSDWAQAGKKEGFKRDLNKKEIQEIQDIEKEKTNILNSIKSYNYLKNLTKGDLSLGVFSAVEQIATDFLDNKYADENSQRESFLKKVDSTLSYWAKFGSGVPTLTESQKEEFYNLYSEDLKEGKTKVQGYGTSYSLTKITDINELNGKATSIELEAKRGNIADMPYKKTDQWVGMAMRRVMQMAANEGFDRVAWTTGEQQANRYDLSNQIDTLEYNKTPEGDYHVTAIKNGETLEDRLLSEDELEGSFGKEAAKKIIDTEYIKKEDYTYKENLEENGEKGVGFLNKAGEIAILSETKEEAEAMLDKVVEEMMNEPHKLEGQDLAVGGEGMKTFYNNILPKVAKKEARRFDKASNVEVISFRGKSANRNIESTKDIIKELEDKDTLTKEEEIMLENAKSALKATRSDNKTMVTQQLSIPITDKAREDLKKGITLFQQQPTQTSTPVEIFEAVVSKLESTGLSMGPVIVDKAKMKTLLSNNIDVDTIGGFERNGTVYINPDNINNNSTLHEFGHLWVSWARRNNNELVKTGEKLVEGTIYHKLIKEAAKNPESVYYNNTPEQILEEALVSVIGDRGELIVNKTQKSKFNEWLTGLWTAIKNSLGLSKMSAQEVSQLTLEQFADAVAIDLLSGQPMQNSIEQEIGDSGMTVKEAIKLNNGNHLNRTSDGKHSTLFASILSLPEIGGNKLKAEKFKAQVYSNNFKQWFGDWQSKSENVSKVVDENGEPQLVYHGGPENINIFNEEFGGETTDNNDYGAFYFTNEYDVAEDYGEQSLIRRYEGQSSEDLEIYEELSNEDREDIQEDIIEFVSNNRKVHPVFLNIKDPMVVEYNNSNINLEKAQREIGFIKEKIDDDIEFIDDYTVFDMSLLDDYQDEIQEKVDEGQSREDAIQEVKEENEIYADEYMELDGLIMRDVIDDIGDKSDLIQDEFVAIKASQIKSIFNEGQFSDYSDDIRYQEKGITPAEQVTTLENTSSIFDSKLVLLDLYTSKEEVKIREKIDSCGR